MQRAMIVTLVFLLCACASADDQGSAEIVGTWVGSSPGQPGEVTFVPAADGSFTWSVFDLEGTWEGDATSLRLTFSDDSPFCPAGNLIWDYQIEGSTLTADVMGGDCQDASLDVGPPSPDWTFERQG